jgi:hypothetical protein
MSAIQIIYTSKKRKRKRKRKRKKEKKEKKKKKTEKRRKKEKRKSRKRYNSLRERASELGDNFLTINNTINTPLNKN